MSCLEKHSHVDFNSSLVYSRDCLEFLTVIAALKKVKKCEKDIEKMWKKSFLLINFDEE